MNHIHHVYRTLNRQDAEEVPRYRPFEDHNYPGTVFNRFEYSRRWDPEANKWIYMKKADVSEYHRQMKAKAKLLQTCITFVMFGSLAFVLYFKSFPFLRPPLGRNATQNADIESSERSIWDSRRS
jgi:hypothetical protein